MILRGSCAHRQMITTMTWLLLILLVITVVKCDLDEIALKNGRKCSGLACTIGMLCLKSDHCNTNLACINYRCTNPCEGYCGPGTNCVVENHLPKCSCKAGYYGDPLIKCESQSLSDLQFDDSCLTSLMCLCKDGSQGRLGQHIPDNRRLCSNNNDCLSNRKCYSGMCKNPCIVENKCGVNARCLVRDHIIFCGCPEGTRGNPTIRCTFKLGYEKRTQVVSTRSARNGTTHKIVPDSTNQLPTRPETVGKSLRIPESTEQLSSESVKTKQQLTGPEPTKELLTGPELTRRSEPSTEQPQVEPESTKQLKKGLNSTERLANDQMLIKQQPTGSESEEKLLTGTESKEELPTKTEPTEKLTTGPESTEKLPKGSKPIKQLPNGPESTNQQPTATAN